MLIARAIPNFSTFLIFRPSMSFHGSKASITSANAEYALACFVSVLQSGNDPGKLTARKGGVVNDNLDRPACARDTRFVQLLNWMPGNPNVYDRRCHEEVHGNDNEPDKELQTAFHETQQRSSRVKR